MLRHQQLARRCVGHIQSRHEAARCFSQLRTASSPHQSPSRRLGRLAEHASSACGDCTKRFATPSALASHRLLRHPATSETTPLAAVSPDQLRATDRASCPTCGDVSAREDLVGEHLAKLPLDHSSQAQRHAIFISQRHLNTHHDPSGPFSGHRQVAADSLYHVTDLAGKSGILESQVVNSFPSPAGVQRVGALSHAHAPPVVWCSLAADPRLPLTSHFPRNAEPGEELGLAAWGLDQFFLPPPSSVSGAAAAALSRMGALDLGASQANSSSCQQPYRLYLCGLLPTAFGPKFRSNMTAVLLVSRPPLAEELAEVAAEGGPSFPRVQELNVDHNPILCRQFVPPPSSGGGGGVQRRLTTRWAAATSFRVDDELLGSSISSGGGGSGKECTTSTSSSPPPRGSDVRPLRIIVAVADDIPLQTFPPTWHKCFREHSAGVTDRAICPLCEGAFSSTALAQHVYSAHEGMSLACSECSKQFASSWALTRHVKSAHEGRGVPCSEPGCSKTFVNGTNMRRHVRNVHERRQVAASAAA